MAWMRLLPAVWRKTILLSFLHFHWLFPLTARETSSGNRSIYKLLFKGWLQGLVWEMEAPSDGLLSCGHVSSGRIGAEFWSKIAANRKTHLLRAWRILSTIKNLVWIETKVTLNVFSLQKYPFVHGNAEAVWKSFLVQESVTCSERGIPIHFRMEMPILTWSKKQARHFELTSR